MKTIKHHITTSITACGLLALPAVSSLAADAAATATASYQPFTIAPEIGTTGIGGSLGWRFCNHFGVSAGMDYLSYSQNVSVGGDVVINGNLSLKLQSEPLTLDWYPWSKHSFHVGVGAVFNQNEFKGTVPSITVSGNTYGPVTLDIQQQPVNPSLTIGGNLFYFDRAHRWAMGGELGAIYTGTPRVSLTGVPNGADRQTALNQINSYAKDAQIWPVLKLSVSYSF